MVKRLWASFGLGHLEDWVQGWVPQSVFSLGNGLSSVEAWFSTALDIEGVLAGARVADVIKSLTLLRGLFWIVPWGAWVSLPGSGKSTSPTTVRFG